MIELTQIKTTDALGQLRGQLNTAFTEIQTDQPFVGLAVNPSINFYNNDDSLVGALTASSLTNARLYLLCYPESNGVFVANVWGRISFKSPLTNANVHRIVIDVPAVKLPTRDATVSTFVSPDHLGLGSATVSPQASDAVGSMDVGLAMVQDDYQGDSNIAQAHKVLQAGGSTCDVEIVSEERYFDHYTGNTNVIWL